MNATSKRRRKEKKTNKNIEKKYINIETFAKTAKQKQNQLLNSINEKNCEKNKTTKYQESTLSTDERACID